MPAKRPRPKLDDPPKFSGKDLSLFPQFFGQLQAKIKIDHESIGTGGELVWYAFQRLEDEAASRIYPWVSTYKNTDRFTIENYYRQLEIAFEDTALKDKALNRLNTLRQGNRPFGELLVELDRLLLEAGGHIWADDVKKEYLRAAINQTLRNRLVAIEEKPTYEAYCLQM
jgi:hypothetical protein